MPVDIPDFPRPPTRESRQNVFLRYDPSDVITFPRRCRPGFPADHSPRPVSPLVQCPILYVPSRGCHILVPSPSSRTVVAVQCRTPLPRVHRKPGVSVRIRVPRSETTGYFIGNPVCERSPRARCHRGRCAGYRELPPVTSTSDLRGHVSPETWCAWPPVGGFTGNPVCARVPTRGHARTVTTSNRNVASTKRRLAPHRRLTPTVVSTLPPSRDFDISPSHTTRPHVVSTYRHLDRAPHRLARRFVGPVLASGERFSGNPVSAGVSRPRLTSLRGVWSASVTPHRRPTPPLRTAGSPRHRQFNYRGNGTRTRWLHRQ